MVSRWDPDRAGVLTIKFEHAFPELSWKRIRAPLWSNDPMDLGLGELILQQDVKRCADNRDNNGKSTESPLPAHIVQESLRSPGTSERCNHVWRRGESEGQSSISEGSYISCKDRYCVNDACKTDGVEDLVSCEWFGVWIRVGA